MPIIPAPQSVTPGAGALRLGPDLTVGYQEPALAPVTEQFCADLWRRTGIRAQARQGGPAVVTAGLGGIPGHAAPLGIDPAGQPCEEGYTLTIGTEGAAILAPEPAGAARALTSLLQLAAVTPPDADG
jgi:hypothetical protein